MSLLENNSKLFFKLKKYFFFTVALVLILFIFSFFVENPLKILLSVSSIILFLVIFTLFFIFLGKFLPEKTAQTTDLNHKTQQQNFKSCDLKNFINSLQYIIFITSVEDNSILKANTVACEYLGYAPEELIQKKFNNLVIDEFKDYNEKVLHTSKAFYIKLLTNAGIKLNVELSGFRGIWHEKKVNYFICRPLTNLNEEKEELLKFKFAVEANPNLIIITNVQGNIQYVNPGFTATTGYTFDDIIGSNPRFLKTEKHDANYYKKLWDTILKGKVWKGELLNKKANGQTFWVSSTITPIKNDKGKVTHFLAIQQDITESKFADFKMKRMNEDLKQAEAEVRAALEELTASNEALEESYAELKEAKEKAEESDKLKSAFLANMSHEVRTPLNGIIGFSDLLTAENISLEKRKMYKAVITSSGNQLLKMITDIIDISKVESGQVEVYKTSFNINKMLDSLYSEFKNDEILREKDKLTLTIRKELPDEYVNIVSDEQKVYQIYSNLISNAIKFSYTGEISFGYVHKKNYLECYVKDCGIGITPEDQKIIFENFRQVEGSLNRQFGGAGIGLSIAKAYIELLDGEISLKSEENVGSTFYFTLPYELVF